MKDISEAGGGSSHIVQAVVNIAAARHMTTTAEGVETEAQRQLLRALGCSEMQGWLFSAAKPAEEIRELFVTYREGAAPSKESRKRRPIVFISTHRADFAQIERWKAAPFRSSHAWMKPRSG